MKHDEIAFDLQQVAKDVIFIDIRTRGYYMISHVENAINIESSQRIAYIAQENQNKIIAVYCHSGNSATEMVTVLREQGHLNVQAIQENFFHLTKYGIKIVGEGSLES